MRCADSPPGTYQRVCCTCQACWRAVTSDPRHTARASYDSLSRVAWSHRGMVVSDPANFSLAATQFGVNTVRTYAAQPAWGPAGYVNLMNQAAAANVKVGAEHVLHRMPRQQCCTNLGCRLQAARLSSAIASSSNRISCCFFSWYWAREGVPTPSGTLLCWRALGLALAGRGMTCKLG